MENKQIPNGEDPKNPVVIYTDGVFDMFHYGHARVLEQCKKMFKHTKLIVGICQDKDVLREKGKFILDENERALCVEHCKWADEVFRGAPWLPTIEFMDSLGAHYMAHDDIPYPFGDIADVYGPFKESGRFLTTQRTEGVSTTDIIKRILVDKELYIRRSLKKGISPEELNLKGGDVIDAYALSYSTKALNSLNNLKKDVESENLELNDKLKEVINIWK